MLHPEKTLEREALLKRTCELDAEIAQHERNLRGREARLPIEKQPRLSLQRLVETNLLIWRVRSSVTLFKQMKTHHTRLLSSGAGRKIYPNNPASPTAGDFGLRSYTGEPCQ